MCMRFRGGKKKDKNQGKKEEHWDKSVNLVFSVYKFSYSLKDFGKIVKKRLQMLVFESWFKIA